MNVLVLFHQLLKNFPNIDQNEFIWLERSIFIPQIPILFVKERSQNLSF